MEFFGKEKKFGFTYSKSYPRYFFRTDNHIQCISLLLKHLKEEFETCLVYIYCLLVCFAGFFCAASPGVLLLHFFGALLPPAVHKWNSVKPAPGKCIAIDVCMCVLRQQIIAIIFTASDCGSPSQPCLDTNTSLSPTSNTSISSYHCHLTTDEPLSLDGWHVHCSLILIVLLVAAVFHFFKGRGRSRTVAIWALRSKTGPESHKAKAASAVPN